MEILENRTKKDVLEDLKKCEENLMELFRKINEETNKIEALNDELDRIEENNNEISKENINKMESLNSDEKSIKHGGGNKKLQCTGQSFAEAQGKYTVSEDKVLQNAAVARSMAVGKWNAWSMSSSWLKCKCGRKCNDEAYWCICRPIDECY